MQQIGFMISRERRNKEIIEWIRPGWVMNIEQMNKEHPRQTGSE